MRVYNPRGRFRCLVLLLLCCASLAPSKLALPRVRAATLTVTTTADELNDDGDCSLREAIQATNQRIAVDACPPGTGDDVIELSAATYVLSRAGRGDDAGTAGDLDIMGDLTIRGTGAAATLIDGNRLDRVLDVLPGGRLTLVGITVRNGHALDQSGGGIANAGTLTLIESVVETNIVDGSAPTTPPRPTGGGIYNTGTLTLIESTIRDNFVSVGYFLPPDTTANAGGGIYSSGTLTVIRSIISENRGLFGGGIYSSGTLHLAHSVVSSNQAGWFPNGVGGGIYNYRSGNATLTHSYVMHNGTGGRDGAVGGGIANEGNLLVINSAISANGATGGVDGGGFGGGIWNNTGALLTLVGSTVHENVAGGGSYSSGAGGGIVNQGLLVIRNSTISGNRTHAAGNSSAGSSSGGILNHRGGRVELMSSTIGANIVAQATDAKPRGAGIEARLGVVTMHYTVIAGNADTAGQSADCAGEVVSEGYNLIQDTSGCVITGTMTGNLLNVVAHLGPLQDNGGPTLTHELDAQSPAIDAGNFDDCPSTDQRGIRRPRDGDGQDFSRCDIGAYEREGVTVQRKQQHLPFLTRAVQ